MFEPPEGSNLLPSPLYRHTALALSKKRINWKLYLPVFPDCHDFMSLLDNCFATLLHRTHLEGIRYSSLLPFTLFQLGKEYL